MGVLGLISFMKKSCPGSLEPCNIETAGKQYKKETGKTPLLIIDGSNCMGQMYDFATSGAPIGSCLLKQATDYFLQFLNRLTEAGIEFKIFIDGSPPDDRIEIIKKREKEKIQLVIEYFNCLRAGTKPPVSQQRVTTPFKHFKLYLENLLVSLNISFTETVKEADDAIMEYVTDGCFGILTQDSDFIIPQQFEYVFSMENLNPETLNTDHFRRDRLAGRLNLLPWHLPFFATVCGNDVIPRSILRKFHESFLRHERNFRTLASREFLPAFLLFPPIAAWLRPILDKNRSRVDLPEYLAHLLDLPFLADDFRKSVLSYKPPSRKELEKETEALDDDWSVILHKAAKRVERGLMISRTYCLLSRAKLFIGVSFQIYDDPEYPCDVTLSEPMTRRYCGVLLKERPPHYGAAVVLEHVIKGIDSWDKFVNVRPTFPSEHPGLEKLWSDNCPAEEKWKMLCWIVSPSLEPGDVLELPEELRVPAMAIFYLTNTLGSRIKDFQVEALLVTAVKLLTVTKEELASNCDWIDPIAIHFGTVYQCICYDIYAASGACGNPSSLFQHPHYVYFDSCIYHVYHLFEEGKKLPRELCAQNYITLEAYDKAKVFLTKYKGVKIN